MKVLYILNASNFTGIGGMEYHLIDLSTWMEAHGVETAIAIRKGTLTHRTLLKDRSNVHALSWTGMGKIASFIKVARLIRSYSPDIISINRERDIIRVYIIAKLIGTVMRKKPKIVAFLQNAGWKRFFVLGKLDGVIFVTEFMKQGFLTKNSVAENKTSIIHCGIPLLSVDRESKFYRNRERRLFTGIKFPLIGMIGEMRKNQTELIDVAYSLKKLTPEFTFALIGRGNPDEIEQLKAKITRLGLARNFIFMERVDRDRIPDVFYDLDLSITTNRSEPFGIVHIESLVSYTPVISYNSGGPVEIIQKGGGILVDGGPEEMAEAVYRVISDHNFRRTLGLAGRTNVEKNFTIEAMGQKTLELYGRVLGPAQAQNDDRD